MLHHLLLVGGGETVKMCKLRHAMSDIFNVTDRHNYLMYPLKYVREMPNVNGIVSLTRHSCGLLIGQ